jgi:hypothetical protein
MTLENKAIPRDKLTKPYVEAVIFFNLEFNYTLRKTTDDNYT